MANVDSLENRFDLMDVTRWLGHLDSRGYVVIKSVASATEAETIKALLWNDLERMHAGLLHDSPDSWHLLMDPAFGLCGDLSQSQGQWHLRGLPKLKEVFTKIWGTDDLLVSMDAVVVRKRGMPQTAGTEGLHIDQNPVVKPVRESVQGMMPLLPVTAGTGGLEVVPESHSELFRERLVSVHPGLAKMALHDDWCELRPHASSGGPVPLRPHAAPAGPGAVLYQEMEADAMLLLAEPGDLILWDSRTVHGGRIPHVEALMAEDATISVPELGRMSCTVAMTPRAFAIPGIIDAHRKGKAVSLVVPDNLRKSDRCVLATRRAGFERGNAFNHCPHQAISSGTIGASGRFTYVRPDLQEHQERLIDGSVGPSLICFGTRRSHCCLQ